MSSKIDVLLVGSGGREHALAWKLAQSPRLGRLYVAPGNGGTALLAKNIPIPASNIVGLTDFAIRHKIGLTVVGPDDPLAEGLVDHFRGHSLRVFGPTKAAARIESSKAFAKELMGLAGIPTAKHQAFDNYSYALSYLVTQPMPIVIKASGLALGKGVYVCRSLLEAVTALKAIMEDRVHGAAGQQVVIEEYLAGPEVSAHAFCDGQAMKLFPFAQDHKAIGEGDVGPNTGGMGTIVPLPGLPAGLANVVKQRIVWPALQSLADMGHPFHGLLFPGLKLTPDGPKVLEFNARFGDPETQCYMRLLKTDLLDILESCVDGRLSAQPVEWHDAYAACVIIAAGGYPGSYEKGHDILGLADVHFDGQSEVFHAGTRWDDGLYVTNGGRVLGVTHTGQDLERVLRRIYQEIDAIEFSDAYCRRDIGAQAIRELKK